MPPLRVTRDSTPSRIFSHTRGTAKKIVGRQSGKSSATVEIERANQVSPPAAMRPKCETERSVMWLSGRNDRNRSSGESATISVTERSVAMMFACVRTAPFGGPVVPLV